MRTVQTSSMDGIQTEGRMRVKIMFAAFSSVNPSTTGSCERLTRNFADDISHRPVGLHVVQLVLVQTQILLHARHESIIDVVLI